MAKGALRVLAFAYKEDVQMASEDNLILLGLWEWLTQLEKKQHQRYSH